MNAVLRTSGKRILSRILPDAGRLRYLSYLPKIEQWRKARVESYPIFPSRFHLYDYLNSAIIGETPIDYLEFGVFRGETIRYWSQLNRHADTRLYGFDTFTGLPEAWENFTGQEVIGGFDVGGAIPQIDDPRVIFKKGLFQETLPAFLDGHPLRSRLVLHNDSDLYSSTMYVLTRCHDVLVSGSLIIFDEFSSILHEFRALEDFCSAYRRDYTVIGATVSDTAYYTQVAIQLK